MRKIIISINPKYVENILSGAKRFEYRTKVSKDDVNSLLIYETYPVKKIVAEAEVIGIISMRPKDLWDATSEYGGISREDFERYFEGREIAYAYRLGKITKFDKPLPIADFGFRAAPQSFVYVR